MAKPGSFFWIQNRLPRWDLKSRLNFKSTLAVDFHSVKLLGSLIKHVCSTGWEGIRLLTRLTEAAMPALEVRLMVTSTNNNQWPTTYPLYGRIWTLTPGITLKEVIWKCSKWFGLLMSSRTGSQRCSNVQIRSKSKFGFLCLPSHVIGSWLVRLMFQQIYLQGAMQYRDRLQRRWTLW